MNGLHLLFSPAGIIVSRGGDTAQAVTVNWRADSLGETNPANAGDFAAVLSPNCRQIRWQIPNRPPW